MKIIMKGISGSQAYGMATPESDTDTRGVFIPNPKTLFGFLETQQEIRDNVADTVYYDIRKFMSLLGKSNPNILELCFLPKRTVEILAPEFQRILDAKDLFISKEVFYTYSGYANEQLHRIKTHRGFLLNPPKGEPDITLFGFESHEEHHKVKKEIEAANAAKVDPMKIFGGKINSMRAYEQAKRDYDAYLGWKNKRNPKRAMLEEKYGMDTKHVSHLVRLYRMGIEILETGEVLVHRPDAQQLLDIRNGKWSYDYLMSWIDETKQQLIQAKETSKLPEKPKTQELNDLCVSILSGYAFS
jgi:hypothetical protein